jgi:hypothetical protein
VIVCVFSTYLRGEFPQFEYHRIDRVGKKMGQTSLVDVDRDGDLDWVADCTAGVGGKIWWFDYRAPDDWVRHTLGQKAPTDVGGTAFDIDGDGWVDQVSGQAWYCNTGKPRREEFVRYPNGAINCHDNVAADIDGDGKLDVVAMSDRSALYWHKIPRHPRQQWKGHDIGPAVHGAVDPAGVGDIDGDGDNDICSKPWNGDEHVYLRNMLKENSTKKTRGAGSFWDEARSDVVREGQ